MNTRFLSLAVLSVFTCAPAFSEGLPACDSVIMQDGSRYAGTILGQNYLKGTCTVKTGFFTIALGKSEARFKSLSIVPVESLGTDAGRVLRGQIGQSDDVIMMIDEDAPSDTLYLIGQDEDYYFASPLKRDSVVNLSMRKVKRIVTAPKDGICQTITLYNGEKKDGNLLCQTSDNRMSFLSGDVYSEWYTSDISEIRYSTPDPSLLKKIDSLSVSDTSYVGFVSSRHPGRDITLRTKSSSYKDSVTVNLRDVVALYTIDNRPDPVNTGKKSRLAAKKNQDKQEAKAEISANSKDPKTTSDRTVTTAEAIRRFVAKRKSENKEKSQSQDAKSR